jgi:hypothetical protein
MSYWKILPLALIAAAALLVSNAAGGGKTKVKPAKTPEEVVANIQATAKAGDLEGLMAQLAMPTRGLFETQVKREQAREALDYVLDAKFGKDPKARPPFSIIDGIRMIPEMKVVGKKMQGADRAELTVWVYNKRIKFKDKDDKKTEELEIAEQVWPAVKEGGAWKVRPIRGGGSDSEFATRTGPDGKDVNVRIQTVSEEDWNFQEEMLTYVSKVLPKTLAAYAKLAKDVKAGIFKDRDDALEAMFDVEVEIRREFPPPVPPRYKKDKDREEKKIDKKV